MLAHKHAALMAEYAKDALETDKPWERWEMVSPGGCVGVLVNHPSWCLDITYRRKRVPLCKVGGRDVFPGDKLWHKGEKQWMTISEGYGSTKCCLSTVEGYDVWVGNLSWTEPPKTKTVYQWAMKTTANTWYISSMFFASEDEAKNAYNAISDFRRLDYTALEVPRDD